MMRAWIYIKVSGKEVLPFGPMYSVREIADEMLADDTYENGNIYTDGAKVIEAITEARTLEGKQFKGFRGYIRTINV